MFTYEETTYKAKPDTNPLDHQEGGSHYKDLGIQPVEYIHSNNLDYFQGNVIKYITRYKLKNGIEDVKKAIHYCQLILEMQYKEPTKPESDYFLTNRYYND